MDTRTTRFTPSLSLLSAALLLCWNGTAAAGDACSFSTPGGSESGSCSPVAAQLACVPASGGQDAGNRHDTAAGGQGGGSATGGQGGDSSAPPTGGVGSSTPVETGTIIGSGGGTLPDTGQTGCYSDSAAISCPAEGASFSGQDAQYEGNTPRYTDNGDGTVTDNVTGLMWQQDPDQNGDGTIDTNDKMSLTAAAAAALRLGGYDDWRLPTLKELYSLMNFDGATGTADPSSNDAPADAKPYLDTGYFKFAYGDGSAGERYIDAQFWSSTEYVGTTMNGSATAFGVNFADGRIKGYPTADLHGAAVPGRYVRYVRGGSGYGENRFTDHGDGTASDAGAGLMWLQSDSGAFRTGGNGDGAMNWEEALAWCEGLDYAGHSDWRLPNAKELQGLVDYTRSLSTTNSAALDPLFSATYLPTGINGSGVGNYPYYWSSTTHLDGQPAGAWAVYVAFGEARGYMDFGAGTQLYDVHGAGAQRSDPKSGDPSRYAGGHGPQGDVVGIYNYARCVRGESGSTGGGSDGGNSACDLNGDGAVDNKDSSAFKRRCRQGDTTLQCDLDGNGRFNNRDVKAFTASCN